MRILQVSDEGAAEELAEIFRTGKTAVFPTDTVYGLGCLPAEETAKKILEIKDRPAAKPFPLLIADLEQAFSLALFTPAVRETAAKLWPGPVTLVLKAKEGLSSYVCREGKVALRIPDYPFLRNVIRKLGQAIIGTSANLSGEEPAGRISDISERLLERVDLVIDGGKISGKASVVYDLTGPQPVTIRA